MYETISNESLRNVVGGACSCGQQPPDDVAGGAGPGKKAPGGDPGGGKGAAPGPGGSPGGCPQLMELLQRLFSMFSSCGAPPSQPKPSGADAAAPTA